MKLAFDRENQFDWQPGKQCFQMYSFECVPLNFSIIFSGKYCIYKKESCPPSFREGLIVWDDLDKKIHIPGLIGNPDDDDTQTFVEPLPDGEYGDNTEVHFCCRVDGFAQEHISLPNTSPFYLLRYGEQCQKVGCTCTQNIIFSNHKIIAQELCFRWRE